jgi:NAD(P)H-dependent flavin oxidoreductase YrpB (nitropropane dioxygenase family)
MAFCQQYGLQIPILQAPMAGSCPVNLAVAVAEVGGMGAMGALMSGLDAIAKWAAEFRSRSLGHERRPDRLTNKVFVANRSNLLGQNERARTETLNGVSIGRMFCLNDNNYQGSPLSGLG